MFWHEQTHAEQRHSIDVLIVEFVQVIFWFNPIIFLLKKCIKLNHEFLADQGVLEREVDAAYYQNTLLAFSSSALQPQLANAINYSLIKKRFTVMKTQSSKKVIWIRSFLFLPLLALLLFSFASRPILEIEVSEKDIILELQQQKEASKQEIVEYNKLANKISSLIKKENIRLKSSDVERLKYLYNKMSKSQRSSAEPFPDFPEPPPAPNAPTAVQPDLPPPPPIPANVTPEQKAKYERATKLYKEKAARAKEKEVYHLKKIKENEKNKVELERVKLAEIKKSQMAERAVKANAEVAQLAEIRKLSKEQKAEMAEEKKARAASIRADRERLQEVKLKQAAERQSVLVKIKEVPKAESPVDHIKKMTEKDADFFYEGKSITSTRALQLIKANKDLHIQSRLKHDNKPEVYISSKPITVKPDN